MWGRGDGAQTDEFSEKFHVPSSIHYKEFYENEGGGQSPFGIFPETHPFWYRDPSLIVRRSALSSPGRGNGVNRYGVDWEQELTKDKTDEEQVEVGLQLQYKH